MSLPPIPYEGLRGRAGMPFQAEAPLVDTANAAWLLGLPLLLTGEPGCGKTDFAFAVARWWSDLQGQPEVLEAYIRSDTRARDLLYTYDAVRRFGDAQAAGVDGMARLRAADVRNYIELAPLGEALHRPGRRVVLIDEIDKAPRDLPNDILRELAQGEFDIPEIDPSLQDEHLLHRKMGIPHRAEADRPFIVITSNNERQLPHAFLRRCVFYHLHPPEKERLLRIIDGWFPDLEKRRRGLRTAVAATYLHLRDQGVTKKPSTSEFIQWVDALDRAPGVSAAQRQAVIDGRFATQGAPWADLPGLGLLVKLPDDLESLGVKPGALA